MIPVIARGGTSFRGVFQYLFYAKGSREECRVAWSETRNMMTSSLEKAWKVMAFTVKTQTLLKKRSGVRLSGRKLEKPVFSYSLSWHPEEDPTREIMTEAVEASLRYLGLEEHEAMVVAHLDEPHKHVHVVVNRVHPFTGKAAPLSRSKRKLSDFALDWEQRSGKIYCSRREANAKKRKAGKQTRYVDPEIAKAWRNSETATGLMTQLAAAGYRLCRGRRRIVALTPHGKTINPLRHLPGISSAEYLERLDELEQESLLTSAEFSSVGSDSQRRTSPNNFESSGPSL